MLFTLGVRRRSCGADDGSASVFQRYPCRGATIRLHEVVGPFYANKRPGGTTTDTDDRTRARQIPRLLAEDRRAYRPNQQEASPALDAGLNFLF